MIYIFIILLIQSGLLAYAITKTIKKTDAGSTVSHANSGNEVLIDTCALIDGRILELARTGFIPGTLLVPQFVILELQGLADGKDAMKRARAREGLDAISSLQENKAVDLQIIRDLNDDDRAVDDKLVLLAKKRNASLYTTDYNLNKVADIEGVLVLNVNELSQLLRPVILPGQKIEIKLVQKGSDRGQAVGYLDDGTMVVVDKAAKKIGSTVEVKIGRSLQTVAGKMMFAEMLGSVTSKKTDK